MTLCKIFQNFYYECLFLFVTSSDISALIGTLSPCLSQVCCSNVTLFALEDTISPGLSQVNSWYVSQYVRKYLKRVIISPWGLTLYDIHGPLVRHSGILPDSGQITLEGPAPFCEDLFENHNFSFKFILSREGICG